MEELTHDIPHSIDAEKSVLGSMLISKDAAELATECISADDFYLPKHQQMFSVMAAIGMRGGVIEVVTVIDEVERNGFLESIGGIDYITEISMFTPSAANVSHYIRIVEERSIMRKLMEAGKELIKDASEGSKSVETMLDDAERRIFNISMRKNADTLQPIQPIVHSTFKKIDERIKNRGSMTGVPTGFLDIDSLTSGLQKSDLVILAARPSMGKTAFALNIAANAAIRHKKHVAIFSLEMSSEQLVKRMLCSEARVDLQHVNKGELSPNELLLLSGALPALADSRIHIDDRANISVSEMRSKCRRLKARTGLDLIVIDYLQLMKAGKGSSDNRVLEISEITRGLKILARELDVPIILLSQLSRQADKRKPTMADLRDSGAIEQDADIIMLIYREGKDTETDDNTTDIIIAKHRNGPTGTVQLVWIGEYTRFADKTDREE